MEQAALLLLLTQYTATSPKPVEDILNRIVFANETFFATVKCVKNFAKVFFFIFLSQIDYVVQAQKDPRYWDHLIAQSELDLSHSTINVKAYAIAVFDPVTGISMALTLKTLTPLVSLATWLYHV